LRSFDIFLGGCGGIKPQEASLYKSVSSEEEVLAVIDTVMNRYEELADEGVRIRDVIGKYGLEAMEG
jgi:NAD(P)H-nitrite reductase large subunit